MGYWGTLVAVRNGGQVPSVLCDRDFEARKHEGALRGDGWRVYGMPGNVVADYELLLGLSAESGLPVLAAYIADSDYGWLVGVSPSGERWEAWLDAKTAFAFERDHQLMTGMPRAEATRRARDVVAAFGSKPAEAAGYAVRWAAEAGYSIPGAPIRQILRTRRPPGVAAFLRLPWKRYVFAEEMFFAILDNLGIPRTG